MRNRISLLPLIFLAGFSFAGCQGTNLFDQLHEDSLSVVVKGTFESNDPRPWDTTVVNDDSIVYVNPDQVVANAYNSSVDLDSAATATTGSPSVATQYQNFPTKFMLDIAEIRADGDKFANHREIYNCGINTGQTSSDTDSFFNGTGLSYSSNDVTKDKSYSSIGIYIRKMCFDNAYLFNVTGGDIDPDGDASNDKTAAGAYVRQNTVLFDENKQVGFDFNIDFMWAYYDTLLSSQLSLNRVFPAEVPISGGLISDCSRKAVIEIRFVVKNFVKRFENIRADTDETTSRSCHFFSFSDWIRDVRPYRAAYLGGNLHISARSYYPDSIGMISGQDSSAAQYSVVMAIPDGDDLEDYEYVTPPSIADDYGSVFPSEQNSAVSISRLNYELDVDIYLAQFSNYYLHLTNESTLPSDPGNYDTAWTAYDTACSKFKIPPLATSTDATGKYKLKNVPVGTTYHLYVSTQSTTPASASGTQPSQAVLPCGWKSLGTATVSSLNDVAVVTP